MTTRERVHAEILTAVAKLMTLGALQPILLAACGQGSGGGGGSGY